MGQFDSIKIHKDKLPLTDDIKKGIFWDDDDKAIFQTKDLELNSYLFEITKDDRLRLFISNQYVYLDKFTGKFKFYITIGGSGLLAPKRYLGDYKWLEFEATFEDGIMMDLVFDEDIYKYGKKF